MYNYKKYFDFGIRIFFASIFIISSSTKLLSFRLFAESIIDYKILPTEYIIPFAIFICISELLVGLMILINIQPKIAIITSIVLLTLFTGFVLWSLLFEKHWICKCFGNLFSSKISYLTLFRNLSLMIAAIYIFFNHSSLFTYDNLSKKQIRWVYTIFLFVGFLGIIYVNFISAYSKTLKINDYIDNIDFQSIAGEYINTENRAEPYLLLIVFSMSDCQSCLNEGFMWQNIADTFAGKVKVIGIGHADREILLRAFIKHKSIKFPVFNDKLKEFAKKYSIVTPKRILLNRKNRIIRIDPCIDSEKYQTNFLNYLKQLE